MSVSVQVPYKKYTAAPGATVFPTTFRVVLASDLKVTVDSVVVTSGFTLGTLGQPSGVDVTFTAPMVGGEVVELQRIIPKSRVNDYQQLGDFNASTVNADIDRVWMSVQEVGEEVNRSVKVPIGSTIDPDQLIEDLLATQAAAEAAADDAEADKLAAAASAAAAAASAASTNLPSLIGKALNWLRVKADESGFETRTAAQTLADIGAASSGNNTSSHYTTTGTSTAFAIAPTPAITAYAVGQSHFVRFDQAPGAAPTLAISGLGTPPNLVKQLADGTYANIAANDFAANHRSRVTLISTTQAWVETINKNGPAFSAYQSTSQAMGAGNWVKLLFQTEEHDDGGTFASSRWTPDKAGDAIVSARFDVTTTNASCNIAIYKNGVEYKQGAGLPSGSNHATITGIVRVNGTTDYIEIYGFSSANNDTGNVASRTYFQGAMVGRP